MARRRESRLTVAEFCRREGVSTASFYLWRRRLSPPDRASSPRGVRPSSPLFAPLSVVAASIEIELPNGAVVRVPSTSGEAALSAAIRAAGGLAAAEGESC
jgi:hypothetical protein